MHCIPLVYYWGERSEPHTCGENGKLSIYIYIWYVRIPYMHSALFVRDAIFPHCIKRRLLKRQDYRKAEQWESTQQGLENGEEREALLARPRLIIDGVLRDSTANGECSVYRAISLRIRITEACVTRKISTLYRHALEETVPRCGVTGNLWNILICMKVLNPRILDFQLFRLLPISAWRLCYLQL